MSRAVAIRIHLLQHRSLGGLLLIQRKVGCGDTSESRPCRVEVGEVEAEHLSLDVSLESCFGQLLKQGRRIS